MDLTKIIEKALQTIAKLIAGEKRGEKAAEQVTNIYRKFWNPINYAIVGGTGVLINYLVWSLLQNVFAWWLVNALAILSAWLWNWGMSVGPFGHLWGFKQPPIPKSTCTHGPDVYCKKCMPKGTTVRVTSTNDDEIKKVTN